MTWWSHHVGCIPNWFQPYRKNLQWLNSEESSMDVKKKKKEKQLEKRDSPKLITTWKKQHLRNLNPVLFTPRPIFVPVCALRFSKWICIDESPVVVMLNSLWLRSMGASGFCHGRVDPITNSQKKDGVGPGWVLMCLFWSPDRASQGFCLMICALFHRLGCTDGLPRSNSVDLFDRMILRYLKQTGISENIMLLLLLLHHHHHHHHHRLHLSINMFHELHRGPPKASPRAPLGAACWASRRVRSPTGTWHLRRLERMAPPRWKKTSPGVAGGF